MRRTRGMEIIRTQSRLMFQRSGMAHRFLRTAMTSSQPGCAETGNSAVDVATHGDNGTALNFLRKIGGFSTLGWFGSEREKSCVYLHQGAVVRVMQSISCLYTDKPKLYKNFYTSFHFWILWASQQTWCEHHVAFATMLSCAIERGKVWWSDCLPVHRFLG